MFVCIVLSCNVPFSYIRTLRIYYAPFARFYALCGTFTHLTQPYAPCATSSRAFSLHIAPLRNIRNRAHLCAPFTHPDRPGSVLVYILAIGLLVVTCRSRDSFGSVDWSEVSQPVPVSFCAPCLRQVSLFYARQSRRTVDILNSSFMVRDFGLMSIIKPVLRI